VNAQLCYFGGSGGFFALWHILLGTDYSCVLSHLDQSYKNMRGSDWPTLQDLPENFDDFPKEQQQDPLYVNNQELIKEVIENKNGSPCSINGISYKKQWNVSEDRSKWKSAEKWPQNDLTQNSSFNNKLFFNCNPEKEHIIQDCDKRILLYTDIETQVMLAKNKHAWKYSRINIEEFESVEKPETTKFNGFEVFHEVDKIAKLTDYQICLQDIVNTQGQVLLDIFNEKVNEDNIFHNNMWLNLHTDEEKGRLLNES
jgi:hypothetical protein